MNEYHNENCQIFNRYKKLIKILNTAEKQKSIKKKNMKRAQKQEYYVKMKRKILAKINQNPQNMNRRDDIDDSGIESSSSELSNDKQKALNLTRLQTLCESKNGYNRSETLCSSQIKQHLKKLQSQRTKSFSSMSIDEGTEKTLKSSKNSEQHVEYGINLKTKHKKSLESKKSDGDTDNSVRQEIQKINEDYIKKLSLVHLNRKISSSEDKPLVYTFFGNQDYQLEEISLNQENKILLGMEEFRQTQEFVEKYILQKGVAPHVNLDPEIELDTSEFKPLEISTL